MGSLVSLVMSDIVDSTRRWNAAEGAMAVDLELHDRLIREVVEGAGGSVFKHTGDGMIAVFDDPVAAAGAAAGIQQAIGAAQWKHPDGLRVRAAVHTGVVYPRDGDLFGTAVNKVARLLGACPPGAVLVSGATTGLLTDRAPEGLTLRPIGQVTLEGFATPDDAHALIGAGLAEVTAVVAHTSGKHAAVPPIHDELVARADELAAAWDALGRARLLTFVGVGGMGKTRLALEVAAGATAAYDGSVWWIDLANATSADAVLPVAMAAVEAPEVSGRTMLQSLCDRFNGVTGLIVVDNCEHVLAAARDMVGALRDLAPGVRVVCTSREALGLRGEQIVPVGSLPVDDGVVLFCERARATRPDLDLAASRPVIERLCVRLDGIPLAIELAAARCRSMSPAEIAARLDDRFRLLRGGREGAERHRTLLAAVAWSYEMLDPDERTVFDQMAVFAGGTLIDGLVAVTGYDELDALDIVDRLVARSMAVALDTPPGTRYHQLETLRQYAEDRLVDSGTIAATRARHLAWAMDLSFTLSTAHGFHAERAVYSRIAADLDNLRLAVAHAIGIGDHTSAHSVVACLGRFINTAAAWEVADWVTPLCLVDGWTDAACICASIELGAAFRRDLRPFRITSVDAVPEWYAAAPLGAQLSAIVTHVVSAGDWEVTDELFAHLDISTEDRRLLVDRYRMFTCSYRQMLHEVTGAEADELVEWVNAVVQRVRNAGAQIALAEALQAAALALGRVAPQRAVAFAREAIELSARLGSHVLESGAIGALMFALQQSTPPIELVADIRAALHQRLTYSPGMALSLVTTVLPIISRLAPDAAREFVVVRERDFPLFERDFRAALDAVGLDVPADLDEWSRQVADVTLTQALENIADALDHVIAGSAAEAAAGGDG